MLDAASMLPPPLASKDNAATRCMYDDIVAQFRGDVHQSMRTVEQEVQLLESLECAAALHDTLPHLTALQRQR